MALKTRRTTISGTYTCFGAPYDSPVYDKQRDVLLVSVSNNPGGNNPFQSISKVTEGSTFRMNSQLGSTPRFQSGCPSEFYAYESSFATAPDVGAAEHNSLLARTNPSNPNFLTPTFLWELKDIPDMIRQGGLMADAIRRKKSLRELIRPSSVARDTASAYLALQFGWRPFISDLWQLATFQEGVEKARKRFEKLEKKGLRGRVPMGSGSTDSPGFTMPVFSSCGSVYYVSVDVTKRYERWATVRWTLRPNARLPKTEFELQRRLRGLNLDSVPISVWKALPWSWLTDYFVNVSDIIKAGNRQFAYPSHECVMTTYTNTYRHKPYTFEVYRELSEGITTHRMHHRMPLVGGTLPTAALTMLSPGQLSTLGALAIQRAPKLGPRGRGYNF